MPADQVSPGRRWVADPLLLMAPLALAGAALLTGVPAASAPLLLLAVVVAGVSLSGST